MEGFDTYRLLADEVGEEIAQQIFEIFAGHTINFPKKINLFFRDLEILGRFDQGETYEELARAFRLSSQQIRHITPRESRGDQHQLKIELID